MRHLVTLALFAAAVAAYMAGSAPGAAALLLVGLVLESLAWYRVFHGRKHPPVSTRQGS
jgi:hypothetical protein